MGKQYKISGVNDHTLVDIEPMSDVKIKGVGNVTITGTVGDGTKIAKKGAGDLYISRLGENVVLTIKGCGKVTIANPIPDSVVIRNKSRVVTVIVAGDIYQAPQASNKQGVYVRDLSVSGKGSITLCNSSCAGSVVVQNSNGKITYQRDNTTTVYKGNSALFFNNNDVVIDGDLVTANDPRIVSVNGIPQSHSTSSHQKTAKPASWSTHVDVNHEARQASRTYHYQHDFERIDYLRISCRYNGNHEDTVGHLADDDIEYKIQAKMRDDCHYKKMFTEITTALARFPYRRGITLDVDKNGLSVALKTDECNCSQDMYVLFLNTLKAVIVNSNFVNQEQFNQDAEDMYDDLMTLLDASPRNEASEEDSPPSYEQAVRMGNSSQSSCSGDNFKICSPAERREMIELFYITDSSDETKARRPGY